MRKQITIVILAFLLGACVAPSKYEVIKKTGSIGAISLVEYLPLSMSRSPKTFNEISDKNTVSEIIRIINRAEKTNSKYKVQNLGQLDSFDYTILFNETIEPEATFLYLLKNQDGFFITDFATNFDVSKSEFQLFKINSGDVNRFSELMNFK